MTIAPNAPPLACASIDDAITVLRERGFRLTASRRLVLEALFAADGPISAEYITTTQLHLDLTSVYRNLETLESQGIVRHVHLGHGPGLYALLGRGEHEYLYCDRCGAVKALTTEQLDPIREQIQHRFGYEARFTHFAIVGICPDCAQQDPADTTARRPVERDQTDHAHSHGHHIHSHPHERGPHEHAH